MSRWGKREEGKALSLTAVVCVAMNKDPLYSTLGVAGSCFT